MGVFDFLFGKPEQTGQLDAQTKRARDFLLDQMMQQYSAGPVNMPTYQAVAPSGMYSGTNSLLASLGLEGVEAPSLPTTTVGGMEVYTSEPFQTQMETSFAEANPGQYDYLRSFYMDPVTGDLGSRSYGYAQPVVRPFSGGGGGGSSSGGGMSSSGASGLFDTHQGPNLSPTAGAGYGIGGYTGIKDMFDGGGAGNSGGAFSGGPSLSGIANSLFGRG